MASEILSQVILGLYADEDGKDEDTALNASINLSDCSEIARLDLSSWKIHEPGSGNRQSMEVISSPTRSQIEAGSRLRFRWSPRGIDSFSGHATVEIEYEDGVTRTYTIKNVKLGRGREWYIFPLPGPVD